MPDTSILSSVASGIHNMGMSKTQRQVNLLAAGLGVSVQPGDELLDISVLSETMIERAQKAGKSVEEIEDGLKELA